MGNGWHLNEIHVYYCGIIQASLTYYELFSISNNIIISLLNDVCM